ncbi:flagellar export chaperone FlgN [Pseudarthrobacter sp. L19]|uniref:flagellar export chaperone FlgN n=1 Tax=Pseudarthrobacter sp. L19 TaxID=3423951 RepID=UPI003D7A8802
MGPMGAGDLSAALWQERRQLELLLFRLETQRLHLAAGNLAWLNFTSSEIEAVLDRLRFEALARNVESAAVAGEWGLPAQATLVELIAAAPPGAWPTVLQDHLEGLRALLGRLAAASATNETALLGLEPPAAASAEAMLDQLTLAANIERALAITRRAAQPLMAQYLGDDANSL